MKAMYTLLAADDEYAIREGLASFHWDKLGFRLCGSVRNGLQALEIIREHRPDVVLTDIKMPKLDGLQLTGQVRAIHPACKLVILTGYKDFEYAKTAIAYGVRDYLLKPVDLKELEAVFIKLRQELDRERQDAERRSQDRRQLAEAMPLALESFASHLINPEPLASYNVEDTVKTLELSLPHAGFVCTIWRWDRAEREEELRSHAFWQSLLAAYSEASPLIAMNRTECAVILNVPYAPNDEGEPPFRAWFDSVAENVRAALRQRGAEGVSVGVGRVYPSLDAMSDSYRQAADALSLDPIDHVAAHQSVQQAAGYISEHYADRITLETVAQQVHLNPSYLSVVFKQELGVSFADYVRKLRIDKAKELLRSTAMKVYEVAESSGYRNQKYFTDTFKQATGLTPLEYRKKKIIR